MTYPTGEMTGLFGDLPTGRKNAWFAQKNFKALDIIQAFSVWNGKREISSTGEVQPMPTRGFGK